VKAKQTEREGQRQAPDIVQIVAEGSEIDEALKRAAREALVRHKQLGLSVPVWRNGHTVWVPPDEIDTLLEQDHGAASSRRRPDNALAEE